MIGGNPVLTCTNIVLFGPGLAVQAAVAGLLIQCLTVPGCAHPDKLQDPRPFWELICRGHRQEAQAWAPRTQRGRISVKEQSPLETVSFLKSNCHWDPQRCRKGSPSSTYPPPLTGRYAGKAKQPGWAASEGDCSSSQEKLPTKYQASEGPCRSYLQIKKGSR